MIDFSKKALAVAAFAGAATVFASVASAAPGYCVAPAPIQTDGLALADVTFTIGITNYSPVDCSDGIVDTGSSNIANNLTYVNNLRWDDFVNGVKDDIGGGNNAVTVDNIAYTLTTGANSGSGLNTTQAWTLSWADTNGATAPNLPVLIDFVLQWNGGNSDVFYLFQNVLLPAVPNNGAGAIDIKVTNPPGNSDIGTSHSLDAYFSNARVPRPDIPVPEAGHCPPDRRRSAWTRCGTSPRDIPVIRGLYATGAASAALAVSGC